MQKRQTDDLVRLLNHLNARHCLSISATPCDFIADVKALYHYSASGFIESDASFGARFAADSWPFASNLFEVVMLATVFTDALQVEAILSEAVRVLSQGGHLVIFQRSGLSIRLIQQPLLSKGLKKIVGYYYDEFSLSNLRSWPCQLLPEFYSKNFTACYLKNVAPLTPLLGETAILKRTRGKYAVDVNRVFQKGGDNVK